MCAFVANIPLVCKWMCVQTICIQASVSISLPFILPLYWNQQYYNSVATIVYLPYQIFRSFFSLHCSTSFTPCLCYLIVTNFKSGNTSRIYIHILWVQCSQFPLVYSYYIYSIEVYSQYAVNSFAWINIYLTPNIHSIARCFGVRAHFTNK